MAALDALARTDRRGSGQDPAVRAPVLAFARDQVGRATELRAADSVGLAGAPTPATQAFLVARPGRPRA